MPALKLVARRGRPRKFDRPSQPVTLTLPQDVVAALRRHDTDLSRAVAALAGPAATLVSHEPAELARYGRSAIITVIWNRALERLLDVRLVPLTDGRALISLDGGTGVAELELRARDLLDRGGLKPREWEVIEPLVAILRNARQSRDIEIRQRNIIVMESRRGSQHTRGRRNVSVSTGDRT